MIIVKVAPRILRRFPVVCQRISSHRRHDGDVEIRKEVFSAVFLAETVLREIAPVGNDGFILPDGLRQYFVGIRERREALGGKKPFNFLQFRNKGLGVLKVCLAAAGHEGYFKKDDDGHKASKTVEKEQSVFEEVA